MSTHSSVPGHICARPAFSRVVASTIHFLAAAATVHGQTYTWTGAVNNTWDTTSANWSGAGSTWVNSPTSDAVFNPLVDITLGQHVIANHVTFNESSFFNYLRGAFTLTLAGTDSGITALPDVFVNIEVPIAGSVGLNAVGGGDIRLYEPCSYSGPTTIIGETSIAVAGGNNRLPITTDVFADGYFDLHECEQQIGALTGDGRVNAYFAPCTLRISGSPAGAVFTGRFFEFGGTFTVIKNGTGTQTLAGVSPNNIATSVGIEAGTLIAAKISAFGNAPVTVSSGGTWGLQGDISPFNTATISGSGAAGRAGAIDNISGFNHTNGVITLAGPATIGASANVLDVFNSVIAGVHPLVFNCAGGSIIFASVSGSSTITKVGPDELWAWEDNSYGGIVNVNDGYLRVFRTMTVQGIHIGDSGTSPTSGLVVEDATAHLTANLFLTVGDNTSGVGPGGTGTLIIGNGRTVQMGIGAKLTVGWVNATGNFYLDPGGVLNVNGIDGIQKHATGTANFHLGGGTLRAINGVFTTSIPMFLINTTSTIDVVSGSSAFLSGILVGPGALTKTGPGPLVLSGNNTYSGLTTVNDGALSVTGIVEGPVTVADGAALGGTGSIGGTVSIAQNAFLSPGASPGELTCGNGVSLNGTLLVEITGSAPGSGYDQLQVTGGNVTLGAQSSITFGSLSGSFSAIDRLYLIDNSGPGATTGTFNGLPNHSEVPALAGLGGQPRWYIYYDANSATGSFSGGNDVAVSPVSPSLLNGSFETGSGSLGTLPLNSLAMNNWKVVRGSVDWFDGWQAGDGSRSVDLQGLNSSGGVFQLVATNSAQRYVLAFKLAGNPDGVNPIKAMRARAGNVEADFSFDTTGRSYADMGWQEHWLYFDPESSITEIELYSTDPADSFGAVVDDVRLAPATLTNDANCDAAVDLNDVDSFVLALLDLNSYRQAHPNCFGPDANCDGLVNALDIAPFTTCLLGGSCGCP